AGAEVARLTADDDRSHRLVLRDTEEGVTEGDQRVVAEGVLALRVGDRDAQDLAVLDRRETARGRSLGRGIGIAHLVALLMRDSAGAGRRIVVNFANCG